jgi:hypothetical protein
LLPIGNNYRQVGRRFTTRKTVFPLALGKAGFGGGLHASAQAAAVLRTSLRSIVLVLRRLDLT